MTPEQKLKHAILLRARNMGYIEFSEEVTKENVDAFFSVKGEDGNLQDAKEEIRDGTVETKLHVPYSRHYESKAVASQMPDGSWVGWIYWYGGGKHGEPEAIDWMDDAYDLKCEEEQVTVTQRTFTKQE